MKLGELIKELNLKVVTEQQNADVELNSVYGCDLLSRVMSKGQKNGMWITVLAHLNIVAVAQLAELACVVIPEDIDSPTETVAKADEEGIAILSTSMTGHELSWKVHELSGI